MHRLYAFQISPRRTLSHFPQAHGGSIEASSELLKLFEELIPSSKIESQSLVHLRSEDPESEPFRNQIRDHFLAICYGTEDQALSGCIIPNSYPWEHLKGRIKHKVINDYGTRDIWPFWARKLSWGYGETGRYGFGRSDVEDRAHNHGHSDYFDESFIRAYWKPLFESGQVVKSTWEEKAPKPSRILEIISMLPVKSLLAVFSTALAIAVYQLVQWLVSSAN